MRSRSGFAVGALLAVAAVVLPATARADIGTAVAAVSAHTDRADAALERAVALFERNSDRRAAHSLAKSRSELGRATAAAARLLREADTAAQRRDAAKALRLVATERDAGVEQLVGVLDEASGRVESTVAQAALTDTRGREKALMILAALAEQVPDAAQGGIAKAVAALSTDRAAEARAEAEALASSRIAKRSKDLVAQALRANVDGQAAAAERLAELIASEDMPEASKPGLQRAYDAVTAEHPAIAGIVAEFSDRMPESVRAFVEQVVAQAHEDAQQLREDRPTPPAPTPPSPPAQGGRPDQTPPPDDTPAS
jgi:hypothetical protein